MTKKPNWLEELKIRGISLVREGETLGWQKRIDVQCSKGHFFTQRLDNIVRVGRPAKQNQGCSICAAEEKKIKSFEVASSALQGGHKILDSESRETNLKSGDRLRYYKISCPSNHEYWKSTQEIQYGCPECNKNFLVGQERVRLIFQAHFGVLFDSVRPDWLKNPNTNKNLELDGYNEKFKIGFEFQGRQHFSNKTQFYGSMQEQSERDQLKKELCEKNSVKLIEVFQPSSYNFQVFFDSVKEDCRRSGLILNKAAHEAVKNFDKLSHNSLIEKYERFKDWVEEQGYKLKSLSLTTMQDELDFECKDGHAFKMTGELFRQKRTGSAYETQSNLRYVCSICRKLHDPKAQGAKNLSYYKKIAAKNGWTLLSEETEEIKSATRNIGPSTLRWACQNGHENIKTFRNLVTAFCSTCDSLGIKSGKVLQSAKQASEIPGGQDIDRGLEDVSDSVRVRFWTGLENWKFTPTRMQFDKGLNDTNQKVQMAVATHPKFMPTPNQIDWGVSEKNENQELRQYFAAMQNEWGRRALREICDQENSALRTKKELK
jgi:hypothetical protein